MLPKHSRRLKFVNRREVFKFQGKVILQFVKLFNLYQCALYSNFPALRHLRLINFAFTPFFLSKFQRMSLRHSATSPTP